MVQLFLIPFINIWGFTSFLKILKQKHPINFNCMAKIIPLLEIKCILVITMQYNVNYILIIYLYQNTVGNIFII